MTTSPPISTADRDKAKELCAKATKGPWEADTVKTEGTYGIGDDTHEGFNEYEIVDTQGRQICSTENRDLGLSEVHDEWDEDSHTAWDEPARRDADFIAFARTAIPAYEARVVELEAALQRAEAERDAVAARLERALVVGADNRARATALLEALEKIAHYDTFTEPYSVQIARAALTAIAAQQDRQTEGAQE